MRLNVHDRSEAEPESNKISGLIHWNMPRLSALDTCRENHSKSSQIRESRQKHVQAFALRLVPSGAASRHSMSHERSETLVTQPSESFYHQLVY